MKKNIAYTIALISLIFTSSSHLLGYRYTFSNHTQYTLLVGIKLCCAFEDLIIKTVKPNKMITFVHGKDFPNIKFGYCLQSISYVKNPTLKNKIRPETAPWKEINTTWIKSETYNDILDFAESFGYTAEVTGTLIGQMALAASTGGTSVPVMATAQGASTVKDLIASTPETEKSQEQNQEVKPASSATTSTGNTSLGLSSFAKNLAKLVSVTTCRDRHWDIYENENGQIMFTSKVQQ